MAEDFSPTARRRRLSAELTELRTAHRQKDGRKTTTTDVATALGWPRSKLSRVENNQWKRPSQRDVMDLLDYYGVDDQEYRDWLIELVREGRSHAWWTDLEDLYGSTSYIGLEAEASKIRTWGTLVPGLLQTEDHAAAIVRGGGVRDQVEIDRRVATRMKRQQLLDSDRGVEMWAVVDEAAIRKPVGGHDVHRAQVQHLLNLTEKPNLTLQMMRDGIGAHPGLGANFTILSFGHGDRPVVHLEHLTESLLLEDLKKTDRYIHLFSHISAAAASPNETVDYLTEVLNAL